MSALLQSESLYQPLSPVTEIEAMQQIGRLASTASRVDAGLAELAAIALRLQGVYKIRIEAAPELRAERSLTWVRQIAPASTGSALARIAANGREWGRLHLHFDSRIRSVETPLRFAHFLAQQMALLLNRLELLRKRDLRVRQLDRLAKRLETRKAVHRASGLLGQARRMSDREAFQLLVDYARHTRRTLYQLAEAIILGYETPTLLRPVLRRLQPDEFTRRAFYDRELAPTRHVAKRFPT